MMSDSSNTSLPQDKSRRTPVWMIVVVIVLLVGFLGVLGASLIKKASPPVKVGDVMPEFSLTTFDGSSIQSSDLRGKVVVINFWASWCTTCADEAEDLQTVWKEFEPDGKVVFLGVDYSDTEAEAKAYIQYFGLTYPSGPDLGTRISQLFRITGVPETYVFDTSGRLASVTIGPFKNADEIRSAVNGLLE